MILHALCELARAEKLIDDPDYERKRVSWVVRLREDGSFVSIDDHRRDLNAGKTDRTGRPKSVGKDEYVPFQPVRTRGIRPFFLVDKAEYALGVHPGGKKAKPAQFAAFRALVEACAKDTTAAGIRAVAVFLQSIAETPPALPPQARDGDLYAFKINDTFIHELPEVREWWRAQRDIGRTDGLTSDRCLVTGVPVGRANASDRLEERPTVLQDLLRSFDLFPLIKVPGGTPSGISISSFNFPSTWSYGRPYNSNAPICRAAAEAASIALRRLLDSEPTDGRGIHLNRRHIRLSHNTVVVYWSPDGDPDAIDAITSLIEARDADAVADAYLSVWNGRPPKLDDTSRFYAMTIVGTQGRAVINDWLESSVANALTAIASYFADLRLYCWDAAAQDFRPAGPLGLHNIQRLLMGDRKQAQALKGDTIQTRKLSTRTLSDWWRVVLSPKRPIPDALASSALQRIRASLQKSENIDRNVIDTCAALLKAWLIRRGDLDMREYLNRQHPEPAYHCGRIMAVLAEIQGRAQEGKTSATIVRRFFGAAMTAPGLYLGRLKKLAETAHLPNLKGDWPRMLRDEIQSICVQLGDNIPASLGLREQSLFTLGFYQEQAYLCAHPPSRYKYRTDQGEWVQSLGEKVVANSLARLGIRYWYEPSIALPSGAERWPDFMIPHADNAKRCFIEVLGMMDDAQYRERWKQKQQDYATLGILPARDGGGPGGVLYEINTTGPSIDGATITTTLMEWFAAKEPLSSTELADDEKDGSDA